MIEPSDIKLRPLKRTARKVMSDSAYRRAAAIWHLRGWHFWALKVALHCGRPKSLIHLGTAPGDDLLCTAVLRELAKREHEKIWMMSSYPELFEGNADVTQVVPVDPRYPDCATLWGAKCQFLEYAAIDLEKDTSVPPTRHIIAELCARAGVTGSIALRPYFYLTEAEKEKGAWAKGMIAIQSSGLAAKWPMRNKQWFPERFQAVVDRLKNEFTFVQLGSASDPPLTGVVDSRGKTDIRQTAAILSNCRLHIGNVGFLMHLARATECPAVIVYGGREAPWQSGYTCNTNLYTAVPCAPCWLWNRCDFGRMCMDSISVDHVIDGVRRQLQFCREELPIDCAII